MADKLELVTDFATLRAGMIVVVKPCRNPGCAGASHREMLLRETAVLLNNGRTARGFEGRQAPRCCRQGGAAFALIHRGIVTARALFRVFDDLESTTEAKQRKSVRA